MRKIRETASRITCVACQRNAEAHSDKLCRECVRNIDTVRQHAIDTLPSFKMVLETAWGHLEQSLPDDLTSNLYERWCHYQQAITESDQKLDSKLAVQAIETMARAGRADPLLDLIRLWLAYTDAKAVYQERERWAEQVYQAIGELDTLRSV